MGDGKIAPKQRPKSLVFSISRQSKHLDRVGRSTETSFHQVSVSAEQVQRFVGFDGEDNVLFVLGRLILRQGLRGVPIWVFMGER